MFTSAYLYTWACYKAGAELHRQIKMVWRRSDISEIRSFAIKATMRIHIRAGICKLCMQCSILQSEKNNVKQLSMSTFSITRNISLPSANSFKLSIH